MTKPTGPRCNLGCTYCFYLEKEHLFPTGENFRMRDDVLETYIRQYIEAQDLPTVTFAWQGGEPTLLGLDFFRKVLALQQKYAGGREIANTLQTNGTLLTDEWGAFFAQNHFLIGISIDGPPKLHDTYRRTKKGAGTFEHVRRGLDILHRHKVEFNTLTVVHRQNAKQPLEVYRYLRGIGSGYLQFIPLVERAPDSEAKKLGLDLAVPPTETPPDRRVVTDWSVEPAQYGDFLCAIFDEWIKTDVGRIFVQLFDVTLGNWMELGPGLCVFSPTCGEAVALEHDGSLYSCDHYVYPRYKLGNIQTTPLREMVHSEAQRTFGQNKLRLPRACRECDVRHLCHGECPKHRFVPTPDGEPGLNYLCRAYQKFFRHSRPAMQEMKALLQRGLPAAGIMHGARRAL